MTVWLPECDAPADEWVMLKWDGEEGFDVGALCVWPDGARHWVQSTTLCRILPPPTHWSRGDRLN